MSREAAFDYILPRIEQGWRILDVGAGESPFAPHILEKGCTITAVDHDAERMNRGSARSGNRIIAVVGDIRSVELPAAAYDCVTAIYSIQHMIGFEPAIWVKIRAWLKPRGIFLCMARYRPDSPVYEGDRGDPLLSHDERTINTLAKFTKFELVDMQRYAYEGQAFKPVEVGAWANAVGFQLRAIEI
jgi:ubiquinone/menaquinone biosynthesis C-methylase UbiE